MDRKKNPRSERGSVFITTMISVLVMSLVSGYAYKLGTQDIHFVHRLEKATQAQQLAEAGLTRMIRALESDWAGSVGDTYSDDIGPGSYTVSVATEGSRYIVESTGTADGVNRLLTAEVSGIAGVEGAGSLDYAIAAGGNVNVDSGTAASPGTITGSAYGGGNIVLDGPSTGGVLAVSGSLDAGGTITAPSGSVTVGGTKTPNFSSDPDFPEPDYDALFAIADANGYDYTVNKTYTTASPLPSPPGGVIYTTGNVTIQGTQSATVCIVARGNVTISKSGSTYPKVTIVRPAGLPNMVASGNITFTSTGNGQAYFRLTGLTYAGGNITYTSGNLAEFTVTGSLQAMGNVTVSPTAQSAVNITYADVGDLIGMNGDAAVAEEFDVVSFNT